MKGLFLILAQLMFVLGDSSSQKCWTLQDPGCIASKLQVDLGAEFEKLDPVFFEAMYIDKDEFKFTMTNVTITGLSKSVIDTVNVDKETQIIKVVFHSDLSLRSKYWSNGILFSKPFSGEGDFSLDWENVLVDMTMPYMLTKDAQSGRDLIFLDGYNFKYTYVVRDGAKYDLSNLFNGDTNASDEMHQLLHENWKDLSVRFGGFVLNPTTSRIFKAIYDYMLARPLDA